MHEERLLPHDLEAEEAIIGSLLIDGDSFSRIAHLIKPEDFYREKNRIYFAACISLAQRTEAINQVTLAHELGRLNQLEAVGGMAYLSHVVSGTPTSVHAEHYAQLVYRTSVMRRLIDAGGRIVAVGYEDGDVDASLRQAEDILYKVDSGGLARGFVPLRALYDQFLQERAAIAEPLAQSSTPIMTSYNDLDELLGGVQRADMVILGARPSLGKSTLAVNISLNAAKNGATVGIFRMEMNGDQLALRMLAAEAEVDSHRLRLGLCTEAEEQRLINAIGDLSELPVFIDDTPFQGILEMRSKARRLYLEPGLDLLVVDYLQLIQGQGHSRGDNRVQEISEISRSLKGMAREWNVPVITCSQLSRAVENRPGHRPQLSDLRDSGSIEQDADIVLFIYREDVYYTEEEWERQFPTRPYPKNVAEIIVAKHRHGPTGSVKLQFRDDLLRFEAMGPSHDL